MRFVFVNNKGGVGCTSIAFNVARLFDVPLYVQQGSYLLTKYTRNLIQSNLSRNINFYPDENTVNEKIAQILEDNIKNNVALNTIRKEIVKKLKSDIKYSLKLELKNNKSLIHKYKNDIKKRDIVVREKSDKKNTIKLLTREIEAILGKNNNFIDSDEEPIIDDLEISKRFHKRYLLANLYKYLIDIDIKNVKNILTTRLKNEIEDTLKKDALYYDKEPASYDTKAVKKKFTSTYNKTRFWHLLINELIQKFTRVNTSILYSELRTTKETIESNLKKEYFATLFENIYECNSEGIDPQGKWVVDIGSKVEGSCKKREVVASADRIIIPTIFGFEDALETIKTIKYIKNVNPDVGIVILLNRLDREDPDKEFANKEKWKEIFYEISEKILGEGNGISFMGSIDPKIILTYLRNSPDWYLSQYNMLPFIDTALKNMFAEIPDISFAEDMEEGYSNRELNAKPLYREFIEDAELTRMDLFKHCLYDKMKADLSNYNDESQYHQTKDIRKYRVEFINNYANDLEENPQKKAKMELIFKYYINKDMRNQLARLLKDFGYLIDVLENPEYNYSNYRYYSAIV